MSFDIHGWVEITRFRGSKQEEEHAWQGLIDLGAIVDTADEVSEKLFGLSERCVSGEFDAEPFAAGRGLPTNPSSQVRKEMEWIRDHEKKYGPGEFGGYTHLMLKELKKLDLDPSVVEKSDWQLVFDLIHLLESDPRLGEDRIRLLL